MFGSISMAFTVRSKKLHTNITKHEKTISIAVAKHFTTSRLFSKAIKDGAI